MQLRTLVALALTLASITAGAPSPSARLKESVMVPAGWVRRSVAPDSHVLPLRIALRQAGMDELLSEHLLAVSDPENERYGQHLSQQEVNAFLAPSQQSEEAVRRWLVEHGIEEHQHKRSVAGDWISVNVSVRKAREMLGGADFAMYQNERSGEMLVRTTEYSLPDELHSHIDLVTPTTYFPSVRSMRAPTTEFKPVPENFDPSQNYVAKFDSLVSTAAASAPASCTTDSVTADCLRDLYGTYDYVPQATDKNLIGFAGFLEQYAIYADLRKFEQRERPDAYAGNRTFTTVLVGDGAMNNQSEPGVEANLDVQTIVGQTYPTPVDFYSTAGRPPFKADLQTPSNTNEPYAVLFEYLVGLPDNKLPKVVSLSYGDDEQTVPYDYALRVCGLIGALGARGVSMIHSSGDSGVGSTNASHCVSNDGKSKKTFLPTFPSTCPYATSVGATQAFAPEVAVDDTDGGYYGGGGFSNYFPIPGYQSSAVPSYIASLGSKYAGLYNKKGRGFPDVSAQGANYLIVSGGRFGTVGGTSASAPTFASVISLLNDARLAAGKRSLGFLNPLLYSKGTAGLNDITSGANAGCGVAGFPAQKGWDPATGLGTPNFPKLKEIVA